MPCAPSSACARSSPSSSRRPERRPGLASPARPIICWAGARRRHGRRQGLGFEAPRPSPRSRRWPTAWQRLPPEFRKMCGDVVIRVEDFATEEVLRELKLESPFDLMGLYQGVSLDRRSVMDRPPARHGLPLPARCSTTGRRARRRWAASSPMCSYTRSATISACPTPTWQIEAAAENGTWGTAVGMSGLANNDGLQRLAEPAKVGQQSDGSRGFQLEGHSSFRWNCGWRCVVRFGAVLLAVSWRPAHAGPTPEEYVAHVGGDAKIVPWDA